MEELKKELRCREISQEELEAFQKLLLEKEASTYACEPKISAEKLVENTLRFIGEDPQREGLLDTPKRVAAMWNEVFAGYRMNPKDLLGTTFQKESSHDLVLLKDIEFYSFCEHHMVPFYGKVHIAYIPHERIVGISKLARLVDCFSKRLQIQERLTAQIADTINDVLAPKGVGVIVEAMHMCMLMRGVKKSQATTITSAMRGVFLLNPTARQEMLSLLKGGTII